MLTNCFQPVTFESTVSYCHTAISITNPPAGISESAVNDCRITISVFHISTAGCDNNAIDNCCLIGITGINDMTTIFCDSRLIL